ncbi:hypothetical protein F4677DRAFT_28136 [Hypoxylon crocopeplum]|nr:hypothetical protein F4677DRAFT_28136 [Hypoxylon crocopeplum]
MVFVLKKKRGQPAMHRAWVRHARQSSFVISHLKVQGRKTMMGLRLSWKYLARGLSSSPLPSPPEDGPYRVVFWNRFFFVEKGTPDIDHGSFTPCQIEYPPFLMHRNQKSSMLDSGECEQGQSARITYSKEVDFADGWPPCTWRRYMSCDAKCTASVKTRSRNWANPSRGGGTGGPSSESRGGRIPGSVSKPTWAWESGCVRASACACAYE